MRNLRKQESMPVLGLKAKPTESRVGYINHLPHLIRRRQQNIKSSETMIPVAIRSLENEKSEPMSVRDLISRSSQVLMSVVSRNVERLTDQAMMDQAN